MQNYSCNWLLKTTAPVNWNSIEEASERTHQKRTAQPISPTVSLALECHHGVGVSGFGGGNHDCDECNDHHYADYY